MPDATSNLLTPHLVTSIMTPPELESAASAICGIAEHMNRLRTSAYQFRDQFHTGDRGFFSPSEDDAVRHLWVSYHMARNALLETIQSLRASAGTASLDTLEEFVVGYAAAVILIDAARCLRDLFGEDEIVRRKLNESYEGYGIASGSFDAIQLSLTSPQNALRINDANNFFDEHADAIDALAKLKPHLQPVLEVIFKFGNKTRVSKTSYVKAGLAEHQRQLCDYVVRDGLLRAIYAVQEWGSRFVSSLTTMPGHVPELPDSIAAELTNIIQAGDVFITRKESAVTNYFLPGYWPHAALYAGNHQVIESLKDGVRQRELTSPYGNDAVAIVRPTADSSVIEQALIRARTHVGKPYDFDFDFTRSDRLVCTEVVYRSFEGLSGITFPLTRRAGRMTLSAEDLLQMALNRQHFQIQAVYCPKFSPHIIANEQTNDIVSKSIGDTAD